MNPVQNIIKGSRHISEMADDAVEPLPYKPISADSHVTEPPYLFTEYLDPRFRDACFTAYNRWLSEFQSYAPSRLFGLGQTAVNSVEQAVRDLERIKEMGFCGVMMPSDRVAENVYFTFQDDIVAFNCLNMLNPKRLLWSNDFPHPDATWPWSRQLLNYQTQNLDDGVRRDILRDNVIGCYNLGAS